MLIAFNKPYGVLSQFTPEPGSAWGTLASFGFPRTVYPIGRLDADSEGLILLSDDAVWTDRLLNPRRGHVREYWVQVERIPTAESLELLRRGVVIQGDRTRPCQAQILNPSPTLPPRDPPVRYRKNVADCWLSLELSEGRNRQVRRMTAAIGHPTLRLWRTRIGDFQLTDLDPGAWRELSESEQRTVLAHKS